MKYHKINNIHTTGVVLFIISLMVLIIGDLFKSNQKIFFNALLYGGFVFLISVVLIFIGTILGARSGKLQQRVSEIFKNSKR